MREILKRESKEFIQPRFNSFYEKYAGLPFSKHPEKYLKFKPEDVLSHIDSFFDDAAWLIIKKNLNLNKNENKRNTNQILLNVLVCCRLVQVQKFGHVMLNLGACKAINS